MTTYESITGPDGRQHVTTGKGDTRCGEEVRACGAGVLGSREQAAVYLDTHAKPCLECKAALPVSRYVEVEIVWRAFRQNPEVRHSFWTRTHLTGTDLCEAIYRDTNTYEGPLWAAMQPLPDPVESGRRHTALTVMLCENEDMSDRGDLLVFEGSTYEVAMFGFVRR